MSEETVVRPRTNPVIMAWLGDVERAQAARRRAEDAARQQFEVAVRNASKAGASLRQIAKAADVSHETIRQILSQE